MQTIASFHPSQSKVELPKLTAAIALAAGLTFGTFAVMHLLISNDEITRPPETKTTIVNLNHNFDDEPITTKPRELPKPKVKPKPEPIPKVVETITQQNLNPGLYVNTFKGPTINTAITPNLGMDNGAARPIVRVEPKYPAAAARDGKEGWVRLSFSITSQGTVDNISVLDSEPRRVFDQAARRALAKWKYKPNMVQGKPQAQDGMEVMLDFKLDS
ncbi:energy transducer TonB [Paraglaciecola sp. 2405UD69-4]|uniref:energy transducer TonB n=1 Tax=Paraglaciecola sp. 2405UD69-4 TaxID=3391836 RepID=UPI0039C94916